MIKNTTIFKLQQNFRKILKRKKEMKNENNEKWKIKYKIFWWILMTGRGISIIKTNERDEFEIRNNKRKKSGIKYTNIEEEALTTWVINIGI